MKPFFFLFFFCFLFSSGFAHLEAGEDHSKNGYGIDFGFAPAHLKAGERANFLFELSDEETGEAAAFSSAWIRISDEKNIVFSGTVLQENGTVSFSYAFPRAGQHSIEVRFRDGENTLVEDSFSVLVEPAAESVWDSTASKIAIGLLLLAIGFAAGNLFIRKRNN